MQNDLFDVLVIGSGFGGSVSAMRLSQKGYRVAVLERGKRWRPSDFPKTNMQISKYLWAPLLRCFGPQSITLLPGVMVLHGMGVGGGSLIYANTLMKPIAPVFKDPCWPTGVEDWDQELSPFYDEAKRMLGVTSNVGIFDAERALKAVGESLGCGATYKPTEVGVFFGEPDQIVPDPYFNGQGPKRTGCNFCGGCMVGCRFNAKNTLDKNYLYFAEKWGARVFAETEADRIEFKNGRYEIETRVTTSLFSQKKGPSFRAKKVIFSAGVLGTVRFLLKNKFEYGTLPDLSPRLGEAVRTNGESLLGSTSFDPKKVLSKGIAIGAVIHPDTHTKIEAVKYPEGSNLLRFLGVPLTPNGNWFTRPIKMVFEIFKQLPRVVKLFLIKDWARSSVILLVMQSIESQMKLSWGCDLRTFFFKGMTGMNEGSTVPSFMPIAQEACLHLSKEIQGYPQNVISEVLMQTPATAHILGGCVMGVDAEQGVINLEHEVHGYPGLYVSDGSVIPCNLGVNPSLTISAMTERFTSFFPVHPALSLEEYKRRKVVFNERS